MHSSDGRWVVAYNGELYNHGTLRQRLSARAWPSGAGRTPRCWWAPSSAGASRPRSRPCEGMFALALWDRHRRQLHLVRDRFGEKPLYYGWVGGVVAFGSELKALRAAARVRRRDRPGRRGPLPAPQLRARARTPSTARWPSCSRATWSPSTPGPARTGLPGSRAYWSARPRPSKRRAGAPLAGSDEELADRLESVLSDSVGRAHGGRRTGRCVPVGRDRLQPGRGPDAAAEHRTRPHLHRGVRRPGLRRVGRGRGRGRPPGHRPHPAARSPTARPSS